MDEITEYRISTIDNPYNPWTDLINGTIMTFRMVMEALNCLLDCIMKAKD